MWTCSILRAYNYFVLVLNSLKPFCLSSEQGLNDDLFVDRCKGLMFNQDTVY